MRCDQHMGLNAWGHILVRNIIRIQEKGQRIFPDGKVEEFNRHIDFNLVKSQSSGKKYLGMFEQEYDLMQYILPEGKILTERMQDAPWSSGPCFFLCLVDEQGKDIPETLWTDEEINNA